MYAADIKRDHKELGAAHGAVFDQVTLAVTPGLPVPRQRTPVDTPALRCAY